MFEKELQEFLQNLQQQKENTGFMKLLAKKSGVNYAHLTLVISGKIKLTTTIYEKLYPKFFEVLQIFSKQKEELVKFKKEMNEIGAEQVSRITGMKLYYVKDVLRGKRKLSKSFVDNYTKSFDKNKKAI